MEKELPYVEGQEIGYENISLPKQDVPSEVFLEFQH